MRKAHGQKSTDRGYRLTTSSGTVCYDSDNTPFGYIMTYGIITCAQNYNFAGMERDSETGNDHTWFRGYEENLGRWMTPDLLGGDVGNPQSLNGYAYALNNPTTLTDPLGLDACSNVVYPASLASCVYGTIMQNNPAFAAYAQSMETMGQFDPFEWMGVQTVTTSETWVPGALVSVTTYIFANGDVSMQEAYLQGDWITNTDIGDAFLNFQSIFNGAEGALDSAYGAALGRAGQFFRGRPPGQSFAACVGQNMSRTFTGSPNSPISTTVSSGIIGISGVLLGGPTFGGMTIAERLTGMVVTRMIAAAAPQTAADLEAAFETGGAAINASPHVALAVGAIGLAPLVGSVANCASVGVAP